MRFRQWLRPEKEGGEKRLDPFPENIDVQYDQNSVGEKYLAMRDTEPTSESSAQFILSRLKDTKEKTLVDVGCGGGQDFVEYLKLGFKDATGVESSKVMADAARKLVGDEAAIVEGTWSHLPFPDASKDYIVGRLSLHYEEDIDTAYRETARVLKSGGVLITIVAHPKTPNHRELTRNGRKYVEYKVYGKVPIIHPKHSIEEYFSKTFGQLFELLEQPISISYGGKQDQLAFIARKR